MPAALPHVLVAEDNANAGNAMRVLYEETGHRVTLASTIAQTVTTCVEDPVALLLLDLGLADGDGLEALAQLRARDAMPRVTVALTGREATDVRERCMAAGCRDVLTKPVPARDLLRMTREWLAPARPAD